MARAKRHHLVPQVYLRRFADERGRITMLDAGTGKAVKTSLENVAVEGNFYTVQIDGQSSDRLEQKHLARIEGLIGRGLSGVSQGWPPIGIVREGLATFVALQLVRGREFREMQTAQLNHLQKAHLRAMSPTDLREALHRVEGEQLSEDELSDLSNFIDSEGYVVSVEQTFHPLGMLEVAGDLVAPLAAMQWDLVETARDCDVEFLTCDEPVVRWAEHPSPTRDYFKMGIFKATEIRVPLDPNRLLVIRPLGNGFPKKRFAEGGEVGALNPGTVANCYRYYFSHPKSKLHPGATLM